MKAFLDLAGQAHEAFEAGDFVESSRLWAEVREQFPYEPLGYEQGGIVSKQLNDTAAAEALFRHLCTHFPLHPTTIEYALLALNDVAEFKRRWGAIATPVRDARYFHTTFHLWIRTFRIPNNEDREWCFRILLEESPERGMYGLPKFIEQLLLNETNAGLKQATVAWMQSYFLREQPLTAAGELAILVFGLYCPYQDQVMLLWKWAVHNDIRPLYAIFQRKENKQLFESLMEMLLSEGDLTRLSGINAYHFALILGCCNISLQEHLLAAILKKPHESLPPSEPLGLLSQHWRKRQPNGKAQTIRSKRRLKIALCVSGQLRGFRHASPSWRQLHLDRHQTDVFVHTWASIGRRIPDLYFADRMFSGSFLQAYRNALLRLGENEMLRRYPAFLHFFYFSGEKITGDELKAHYQTDQVIVENDKEAPFKTLSNAEKMYYKVEACFEMAMQSGKAYDIIIRLRPDKIIKNVHALDWAELYRNMRNERLIYCDEPPSFHGIAGYKIGDQFAAGDGECMALYSRTYSSTKEAIARKVYGFPGDYTPHANFAHMAFMNGIRIEASSMIEFGALVDPDIVHPGVLQELLLRDIESRMRDDIDEALLNACKEDLAALAAAA